MEKNSNENAAGQTSRTQSSENANGIAQISAEEKAAKKAKRDAAREKAKAKKIKAEADAKAEIKKAKKDAAKKSELNPNLSKPGVIRSIADMIISNKKKGLTKKEILARLVKKFPEREEIKMFATINAQVPTRLNREKGLKIEKKNDHYIQIGALPKEWKK